MAGHQGPPRRAGLGRGRRAAGHDLSIGFLWFFDGFLMGFSAVFLKVQRVNLHVSIGFLMVFLCFPID